MKEEWRDVIDYTGLYQVSNKGRVRSLDRHVNHTQGTQLKRGKLLTPAPDKSNYRHLKVCLCKDGTQKSIAVHKLVAEAFLGPCPEDMEVRHGVNGVADNSVENLSYGTKQSQWEDRYRDGTHCGKSVIRSDGKCFQSIRKAARESGTYHLAIKRCCEGSQKMAGGYSWKYKTNVLDEQLDRIARDNLIDLITVKMVFRYTQNIEVTRRLCALTSLGYRPDQVRRAALGLCLTAAEQVSLGN